MLLHEKKDEDGVKNFFQEVHELYLKVSKTNLSWWNWFTFQLLMNPFYVFNTPITSTAFDDRVKSIAKRRLDV